jgi:hypothetical protein
VYLNPKSSLSALAALPSEIFTILFSSGEIFSLFILIPCIADSAKVP